MQVILSDKIITAITGDAEKNHYLNKLLERLNTLSVEAFLESSGREKFKEAEIFISREESYIPWNIRLDHKYKARLYYIIVNDKEGNPLLLALDVDWEHKYETFSFLHHQDTRNAFIPWIQEILLQPTHKAEEPRTIKPPKKSLDYNLTSKQSLFSENNGLAKITFSSAGSGKTVALLSWMQELLIAGYSVRYVAPTTELCLEIRTQLSFEETQLYTQTEATLIPFFLNAFPRLGECYKNHGPVTKITFKKILDTFLTQEKKSHCKSTLTKTDFGLIYAEITQVILQPNGDHFDTPYLSEQDYLSLGNDQSFFDKNDRCDIYRFFKYYCDFLIESQHDTSPLYEPRLLFHEIYIALRTDQPFASMTQALAIDEAQMIHPSLLLCLLEITSEHKTGLIRIGGDPLQTRNEPRRHVLAPTLAILKNYQIPVEIVELHENLRNARVVGLLGNAILHMKALACGTRERRVNLGLANKNTSLSGQIHIGIPTEEPVFIDSIKQDARCVVIVPDNTNIEAISALWGQNVFPISRIGGLEWDHVIFLLSDTTDSFQDALFSEIASQPLLSLNSETVDTPPPHARKTLATLSLEIAFSEFYLVVTRARESFRLISHNPAPTHLHTLCQNITTFEEQEDRPNRKKISAIRASSKTEWLETAALYFEKNKLEEGYRILWSNHIWDSDEAAENAKMTWEMLSKRANHSITDCFDWVNAQLSSPPIEATTPHKKEMGKEIPKPVPIIETDPTEKLTIAESKQTSFTLLNALKPQSTSKKTEEIFRPFDTTYHFEIIKKFENKEISRTKAIEELELLIMRYKSILPALTTEKNTVLHILYINIQYLLNSCLLGELKENKIVSHTEKYRKIISTIKTLLDLENAVHKILPTSEKIKKNLEALLLHINVSVAKGYYIALMHPNLPNSEKKEYLKKIYATIKADETHSTANLLSSCDICTNVSLDTSEILKRLINLKNLTPAEKNFYGAEIKAQETLSIPFKEISFFLIAFTSIIRLLSTIYTLYNNPDENHPRP